MTFADHFSTIAAKYAAYRPRYPRALVDALADLTPHHAAVWDAGCGNGQLSVALAERFARVIATDPSQAQIDAAIAHPRVEYRTTSAEHSLLDAASVDFVVAAQAAHWFVWPEFVAELQRVARPEALLALVSYGILIVDGDDVNAIIARYYREDAGPYWPKGREHVENGYRDFVLPWKEIQAPAVDMIATWTRDELLGYISTWSATVKLVAARGEAPYVALQAALAEVWPDPETRTIRWPPGIRVARR
jgi:SAM-dependent methyltransferase